MDEPQTKIYFHLLQRCKSAMALHGNKANSIWRQNQFQPHLMCQN